MSVEALPITSARFASALNDLPISSLHAKVSELRNSITHLQTSNTELEEFIRQENDKDCYEALMENKQVIRRMEERIELVRKEIVEVRGLPFEPEKAKTETGIEVPASGAPATNGTGSTAQIGTSEGQDEEGVFL